MLTVTEAPEWSRLLAEHGLRVHRSDDRSILVGVDLRYEDVEGELIAEFRSSPDDLRLDATIEVASVDVDRLYRWQPRFADPGVHVSALSAEELRVRTRETNPSFELGNVVGRLAAAMLDTVATLVDDGIVDLVDAAEDQQVAEALASVPGVKERDPKGAIEMLRGAADRCRRLGNPSLRSQLELAAGELLVALGEIASGEPLIEAAWARLGEPVHWADGATVLAQLRARQGRLQDAIDLFWQAIAAQEDGSAAAVLEGDLGVLLAQSGRRVEASQLLARASADERLDDARRQHFRSQLTLLRSAGFGPVANPVPVDVTDRADAHLNALASLVLAGDRGELTQRRPKIEELLELVEVDLERLGPSHMARHAMGRGVLLVLDDDAAGAKSAFASAESHARRAGDDVLARWIGALAASILAPLDDGPGEDVSGASSLERVVLLTNHALGRLAADRTDGRRLAARALAVVDAERHRYTSVEDRLAWTAVAARVYELCLTCAVHEGDFADAIEILERARAQGAPVSDPTATPPRSEINQLLTLVRESLGDLRVGRPIVASIRPADPATDGPVRVPLTDVIAAVAEGPAWWWAAHAFGERLHWAVRSPAGVVDAGTNVVPGGRDALNAALAPFASISGSEGLARHPLGGDQSGQRERLLRWLADVVMPPSLRDALQRAAVQGDRLPLIWAAPRELAVLPVGLLPVGEGRVALEGGLIRLAPPTSLAMAAPLRTAGDEERALVVVLGADSDLGMLRKIADAGALAGGRRLGATRHVLAGLAESLASPDAVREVLRHSANNVVLYYGHIESDGSPLSASLSLTYGAQRASLRAADLLVSERQGGPFTVVLAGCSSLDATRAGTGEWWGLASALLWQGAHHVVGSTWDLLACEDTQDMAFELAQRSRRCADPANDLWELQLARYRSWRTTGTPVPYHWAGWSVLSASGRPRRA